MMAKNCIFVRERYRKIIYYNRGTCVPLEPQYATSKKTLTSFLTPPYSIKYTAIKCLMSILLRELFKNDR